MSSKRLVRQILGRSSTAWENLPRVQSVDAPWAAEDDGLVADGDEFDAAIEPHVLAAKAAAPTPEKVAPTVTSKKASNARKNAKKAAVSKAG